jgi:hypothetical protein
MKIYILLALTILQINCQQFKIHNHSNLNLNIEFLSIDGYKSLPSSINKLERESDYTFNNFKNNFLTVISHPKDKKTLIELKYDKNGFKILKGANYSTIESYTVVTIKDNISRRKAYLR